MNDQTSDAPDTRINSDELGYPELSTECAPLFTIQWCIGEPLLVTFAWMDANDTTESDEDSVQ